MILYIPLLVYSQIQEFVRLCPYEISGLGKIKPYKNGFLIEQVKLLSQSVTPANTRMDVAGLGKLYHEIIQEEGDLSNWKLWWHSHASMPVFWSQTDLDTIMDFDNETPQSNWMISAVFNHKMDWEARLDMYDPVHVQSNFTDLRITQIHSQETKEDCQFQIDQKVRVRTPEIKKVKLKKPYVPIKPVLPGSFFDGMRGPDDTINMIPDPL